MLRNPNFDGGNPFMTRTDFIAIFPEIFLLIWACVLLLADLFVKDRRLIHWGSLLGLAVLLILSFGYISSDVQLKAFGGAFVNDSLGNLLKIGVYIATAATFVMSRQYLADRGLLKGEFYSLALFALLGQMVMISASNMLTVYLGLELMSLALYALVALHRDDRVATESAMKYFVLGALASGFLLYGISMLYGATGSFDIQTILKVVSSGQANKQILVFASVFIVAGLAFKLGVAPFHMWLPDVYHGSPTAITLLLAGAPKLAALALTLRVLIEGLLPIAADWQPMLWFVAVMSLLIGNLTAIVQTNLKRMLAYSTIAHMGFVAFGLSVGFSDGNALNATDAYSAATFYMLTYVLTTLGTFGLILVMASKGFEADQIDDLRGLSKRQPAFAALLLVLMFSLAGIPLTVGFPAKLAVIQALVSAGHIGLAVFAVLASLVGAFYYLRVVKAAYFDTVSEVAPVNAPSSRAPAVVLACIGTLVLLLGTVPGPGLLLDVCTNVIKQMLGA
jgi:NADH-quinone oxidoreductase subunit N